MELVFAMLIAYIPFLVWAIKEVNESRKPKKRTYETSKADDYWLR